MSEPLTFKRLCDAAVTMGEMSQGTADYFHGLYLNSDEHRELEDVREMLRAATMYPAEQRDGLVWHGFTPEFDARVARFRAKLRAK